MRTAITVTGLTRETWALTQEIVQAEYEIPDTAIRVCVTFVHEDEERHVEMPLIQFGAVLRRLVQRDQGIVAEAVLTPDALPDHLKTVRNQADPARLDISERWYPR